ncbi:N-acetyl-D-glucosamine kinase [Klebsiella pneumoniae]|uniref:N-acetyl-D-glucosamine kinase n=1 Tax=Klebsiella pneumoniae TaxID=573 RepID=A0A2X3CPX5_KLEPN|nr:N-acetyl-D-glucosamine kinase [Klebsiella pneumoniae]
MASNLSSSSAWLTTQEELLKCIMDLTLAGSKIALGVFNQERRLQWEKRVATPKSSYEDFSRR